MAASEAVSISLIISIYMQEQIHFQILKINLSIIHQSCQLTPAVFASASTVLPKAAF